MNWNEIFQWSQKGFIACGALALQLTLSLVVGQETKESKPKVSDQPLAAEQLAIYRAILAGWVDDGKEPVHLAIQTVPLDEDIGDCAKGIALEPGDPKTVHRFRKEDLAQLGSAKIGLVDPEAQEKEVSDNDPGKAIRNGSSIDEAVRNGFNHGLVTLSEIRFEKNHESATVWYGFHCGSLCGNGGTAVIKRKDGVWKRISLCSMWMSRQSGPLPAKRQPAENGASRSEN